MSNLAKRFRDLRYRIFYGVLLNRRYRLATLCAPGSICPWTLCTDGLRKESVVYSGGVGGDISFEHELVKQFGCSIVLYDPSPAGRRTMALPENQIPQFHYFPLALAAHSGNLSLAPPPDAGGDSWFASSDAAGKMEVPCIDLASLMKKNGHDRIDLLKLDIEGCEYEVIDDLLQRRIPVGQICVEYHHGILPGYTRSQSIRSMFKLIRRGYKMISQEGANHTFILGSVT